jgi:hypothetical protein
MPRGVLIAMTICVAVFNSQQVFAQGATCSSYYSSCYDKSVQGMPPAKAKTDCQRAIGQCKRTGCFVGPHSGTTFACNLSKS